MSSELDRIGLSWEEEENVRSHVAANITATTTKEVMEYRRLIEKAWEKLGKAEDELGRLDDTSEDPTTRRRVRELQQNIPKLAAEVQRLQLQYEQHHQAQMNKSMKEKKEQKVGPSFHPTSPHFDSVKEEQKAQEQLPSPAVASPSASALFTQTAMIKTSSSPHRHLSGSAPRPHVARMVAPGDHLTQTDVSNAVQDYRGGDLLPSAGIVTASDFSRDSKKKYLDDGNIQVFQERQRKRRRAAEGENEEEKEARERMVQVDATEPRLVLSEAIWNNLLDYQKTGVRWLLGLHMQRVGGILGDEMGLGKTVQIAALLNCLHASNMLKRPVLIVCPLTVLGQWVQELHKWAPLIRSTVMHSSGTLSSREDLLREVVNTPSVVLSTYTTVTLQVQLLLTVQFQYLILDEGHKISNPDTSMTLACKSFPTVHRLVLSGSPIQNTLKELWCLFDFVAPGLLGSQRSFIDAFETPISHSRNPRATSLELATAVECAKLLRKHIRPFLLRRLKKDVNSMLPPKHERIIRCSLTDRQLEQYVELLTSPSVQQMMDRTYNFRQRYKYLDKHNRDFFSGGLVSGIGRGKLPQGIMHQGFKVLSTLRQICNHADIHRLKEADEADGGTGKGISFRSNNQVALEGSGKLITLRKLMRQWKMDGHKILIFSQTRMMLDIIENLVDQEGYTYIRMDGTTASRQRPVLIDRFNTTPSIFVALLTTRVGGLGVNLTGADRVVIFDPDWNPVTDDQARERAWRIGQSREVCIYRLITTGTVEEHILHRQLAKTYVTDKVLQDPTLQQFFSMSELQESFLLGEEYAERLPEDKRYSVISAHFQPGREASANEYVPGNAEPTGPATLRQQQEQIDRDLQEDLEGGGGGQQPVAAASASQQHETELLSSLVDGSEHGATVQVEGLQKSIAQVMAARCLRRAVEERH